MIILKNNGWHEWVKTGDFGQDDKGAFAYVQCDTCTMKGIRYNDFEVVVDSSSRASKRKYCVYTPSKIPRIKLIADKFIKFGFNVPGVVEVLPCPREFEDVHADDPWVFSTTENKVIRVGEEEYEVA